MQKQNLSIGFLNFVFQFIKKTKWRFGYTDSLHINWRKPNLNAQQNHLAFVCFSFVVFCISLSSIVVISSTLIIGIFYCLKRCLLPALCLAPGLIPGSGPQFVFTRPGPQFVFTGPGPHFVFNSPGPESVFTSPDPKFVFSGPGPKFVFTDPGF